MITGRRLASTVHSGPFAPFRRTPRRSMGPHDDPPFLYWVTRGEVEMIAGSSALEMNDPSRALRCFNAAAQADYPGDAQYPRTNAIYLARAAEAHLAKARARLRADRSTRSCTAAVDCADATTTRTAVRKARPMTSTNTEPLLEY